MSALESIDARYDTVVVGARLAGAATAMLLARTGLRVLAIDRGQAGADTLSTHALMRGGMLQLTRWGLLPRLVTSGVPAIRTTTFHYGDESLEIAIQPRDGVGALAAPRRTVLDPLLVEAARESGARVLHGVRARRLLRDDSGRVRGVVLEDEDGSTAPVEAGLVVGADGIRSQVAEWAGSPTERAGRHAAGILYGYWKGLGSVGSHWYYRPGVSIGSIPTNDGLTCLFVAVAPAKLRESLLHDGRERAYAGLLAAAEPELARRLAGAERVGLVRSFPGMPGYLRRAHGPGWALVGDAGFFRDPITAHGMTDALRDAEMLARAALHGGREDFEEYQRVRDELAVEMLEISDEIASFSWDLDRVRGLHRSLSRNMAREVERIASWGDAPPSSRRPPVCRPAHGLSV